MRPLPAGVLQPKLIVGEAGNEYEQEAERVSESVMRAPRCLQRKRVSEEKEDGQAEAPPVVHDTLNSPGQPLDPSTRSFMEERFGHHFSHVRVHTDEQATRSARAVGALAYTVGPHLVFQRDRFSPETPAGRQLLAHELTHVVQQGAAPNAETSKGAAAGSGNVLQRQGDPAAGRPAETPTPQPTPTAPPPQPEADGGESTSQSGSPQTPSSPGQNAPARSNWTPDIPYIWFDLHDIYKFLTEPSSPYLYSSLVYRNRVVNPDFSNNLNPGPVHDMTALSPNSLASRPSDLQWNFFTKFFVDSAAAPLPSSFTRFETSANIIFTPTGGGSGFSSPPFADNNPQYLSPGGLSYPFALVTNPPGFRLQSPIMQPGVLQWDARLRLSQGGAASELPVRIVYTAPPQLPNEAAFRAELMRRGARWRDAAPGERARTYRIAITPARASTSTVTFDILGADGTVEGTRRISNLSNTSAFNVVTLIVVLAHVPGYSEHRFGSSSDQYVEIRGSQRVRFERPSSSNPSSPSSP